jgi:lipopolysaccharide/colanic/teichoic acid biosynthesis glycosyltransferase
MAKQFTIFQEVAMRPGAPSSRSYYRMRISAIDASFALASPLFALWLRDAPVLSDGSYPLYFYWFASTLFSVFSFLVFGLERRDVRYFSVDDIFEIVKAVLVAELLTSFALFAFTRLDGIPRTTLLIHSLVLAGALVASRTAIHVLEHEQKKAICRPPESKHVIMVGFNFLSSAFIKWLETNDVEPKQVVAILDESKEMIGRRISGVQVIANPMRIAQTIEEFAIHGVKIDEVIVSGGENHLSQPVLAKLRKACDQNQIELSFMPQIFHASFDQARPALIENTQSPVPPFPLSRYFAVKRAMDFVAALVLIVLLLPLFLCTGMLVLLDVGAPLLFWQRRLGQSGQAFHIYKFRTMRTPFDRFGEMSPESHRVSLIGHMLRRTGLDELPQLLNVLVGDMSLIGPRPLLPQDQPENPVVRLMVRPGITGWAQVNGGKEITTEEKDQLDEWYIRNASLLLDLRIALLTFRYIFLGNPPPASKPAADSSAELEVKPAGRRSAVELRPNLDQEVA